MPSENTGLPNTIKYSIWETQTDGNQHVTKEKSSESIERPILDAKVKGNQD